MRKTIISLVVALASLVPVWTMANGMPSDGRKAPARGSSASAGNLTMADLSPDAPAEYTVVKGDTLWGISGKFLKDPWRWPQIWQMNREQIKNPHLIYPGDIVRLDRSGSSPSLSLAGGGSGGTAAQAAANVVRVEPRVRIDSLQSAIPSIPGSAIGPFLSQPLVVDATGLDFAPTILASEDGRVVVGAGETAYADRIGTNSPLNWQIFRPGVALRDPESGEILGYEARYVGDARVRRFGNPTTLEILKSRQEITKGDRLTPAREATIPNFVPRAPEKVIKGSIMAVDGGVSELGQFQVVSLNRGARDGLEIGHVLASYHRGATIGAAGSRFSFDARRWFQGMGFDAKPNPVVPDQPRSQVTDPTVGVVHEGGTLKLPDERNGLLIVVRVFEKMSYAMVMRASKPIHLGDIVQTP